MLNKPIYNFNDLEKYNLALFLTIVLFLKNSNVLITMKNYGFLEKKKSYQFG